MLGTSRVTAMVMASLLVAAPALAQTPSEKDKQFAGDLVKQAIAKSQAKQHNEAIDLYLKAYTVVPLPTLLSNVGTEYQQINKPVEALKYFCLYLEKDPTGPLATYATSQAKVLQIQLGNPDVDDTTVCKPAEPPPPDPQPEPEPAPVTPEPGDPGSGMKTAGLVTVGLGVISLGVGFYFGAQAKSISDEISGHTDPNDPWRDDIRDYQDKGQRYENIQIATLIAGGALVVAGGFMYLRGRSKSSSTERVTVAPSATPSSVGFVLGGSF